MIIDFSITASLTAGNISGATIIPQHFKLCYYMNGGIYASNYRHPRPLKKWKTRRIVTEAKESGLTAIIAVGSDINP